MPLAVFKGITSNVSWVCCQCGIPNFSTTLFDTTMADSIHTSIMTNNSYSILSDPSNPLPQTPTEASSLSHSIDSLESSFGSPQHTSSPARVKQQTTTLQKYPSALRVLVVNFQSIRAKRQPFWLLLEEAKPDIIIGSETWLHAGIFEREFLPSGYHTLARRDRKSDPHGGVIVIAKENIVGVDLHISTNTELAVASVQCPGKEQLIVASAYRPPTSSLEYMQEMAEKITQLYQTYPKATIWVAGDLNLPDIDWSKHTVISNQYNHAINQQYLDLLYDTGSEQVIKFPTRGDNILDLFSTNRPSLVTRCKSMPGVSDHDIAFVEAHIKAVRKKPPRRKILLWTKANPETLKTAVSDFSTSFMEACSENTDVETMWCQFKEGCLQIMEEKVPSKLSSTRHSQPWINKKIKRLSRRKKRAYRKAKKSGEEADQANYKRLQKETQYECKKAYNTYIKDIVTEDKPKKLYSFINSKRCDSSGVPLLKKNGIGYSDPKNKAAILNDQFSSVFTEEDQSHMPPLNTPPGPDMHKFTIHTTGIEKLMKGLNPHKAQGPDNIPTRFLKDYATELAPCLTLIFSASLQQGKIPTDWKQANVTPLFKKGDKTSASNYRPISLTSVCCKLMEHVIHSQVMKHLDQHKLLSDSQHGFRKRRSCETQLIITIQDIAAALEDGEQIDAILLDFSKAFDKVPHGRLLYKLRHLGIHGQVLRWIESFLSNRSQRVLVEGHTSEPAAVSSGVPQGSVLGPLLFLVYINDMPGQVCSSSRLFADDSLLYRRIRTAEDSAVLQRDLERLEQWEKDWQMEFNPTKCEVLRFTRRRNPLRATYTIHGHTLQTVPNGKYLGVNLNEKLSWNQHVDATTKKANNSLAFLRRNLASCPTNIRDQCYKSLVRPIVEYASPVWDPHTAANISKVEAVQRRAARFVCGDYRTTSSTSEMIANLQWPSLQQRRQDAKVSMIYRIHHNLVDIPTTHLRTTALSTRGHPLKFFVPYTRTDIYKASFFPSGIRLWNQLPASVVAAATLESFKASLSPSN